jgi:hypothetical protein
MSAKMWPKVCKIQSILEMLSKVDKILAKRLSIFANVEVWSGAKVR